MINSEQTRLRIKGVKSLIKARVTRRGRYSMTVTQPLSFLELESGVEDADGREARIRSVSINYEGSTPHLVLDLIYDDTVWLDDLDDGSLEEMELDDLSCLSLPPARAHTLHYQDGESAAQGSDYSDAPPNKGAPQERRDPTVPYVINRCSGVEMTIGANREPSWLSIGRDSWKRLTAGWLLLRATFAFLKTS